MKHENKTICHSCGNLKTMIPSVPARIDIRRKYMDEKGKTWYGKYCPECARNVRYEAHRSWIERRALRLGRPFPKEGRRRQQS